MMKSSILKKYSKYIKMIDQYGTAPRLGISNEEKSNSILWTLVTFASFFASFYLTSNSISNMVFQANQENHTITRDIIFNNNIII